jgi:hypothetical protein
MQIEQIIIRPAREQLIVQYSDRAGRTSNLTVSTANNASVAAVLADAANRLPTDAENPAKAEIQQEIGNLEDRIRLLKQSIGAA